MRRLRWVAAALIAAVVLVVGGTWVYINVIRDEPPPPLAFQGGPEPIDDSTTTSTTPVGGVGITEDGVATDPLSGTWVPTEDSVVGYRVGEVLFGQRTEGVGRTDEVAGEVVIDTLTVRSVDLVVDMATLESDDDRRDRQFRGRIMDVATHPTAALRLLEPIELDDLPDDGEIIEVTAPVELTLRGTTRPVDLDVQARRNGPHIEITGTVLVVFEDWGIPNPSTVGVTTDEEGALEFLVVLERR